MIKTYSAWPTKAGLIGPVTATVPDMGTATIAANEKYYRTGTTLTLDMADAKFALLPVEWVEV
jgi:hypothetical protein